VEISPQDVQEALLSNAIRLIDVRGEDEWNEHTPIVFYCHGGIRGLSGVHFFRQKGFTDAWSLTIGPNVPRY